MSQNKWWNLYHVAYMDQSLWHNLELSYNGQDLVSEEEESPKAKLQLLQVTAATIWEHQRLTCLLRLVLFLSFRDSWGQIMQMWIPDLVMLAMWHSHCSPVCCMTASSLGATQSVQTLCPVRQLFIHFSHSVHPQSFWVSLMLPFILSAGFTIRTTTPLSLTTCAFILLPTYFIWVDVWALNPLWHCRLGKVCVCLNKSRLFDSFHFHVDRHFLALLQFYTLAATKSCLQ